MTTLADALYNIVPEEIDYYCEEHTSPEEAVLYKLNRDTNLNVLRPRMLSGHLQGRFLSMLSRMMKPDFILEIGTYTGYSALCLAEGLSATGILDTVEIDPELSDIIMKYVSQSRFANQIHLHIGDAALLIPQLAKPWDMVFIDAEKKDYIAYYELVVPQMRKGGLLIIDNILWSGKVVSEISVHDKNTKAIVDFNDHVQQDDRVTNVMLPFRDGITMVMKE